MQCELTVFEMLAINFQMFIPSQCWSGGCSYTSGCLALRRSVSVVFHLFLHWGGKMTSLLAYMGISRLNCFIRSEVLGYTK